MNSAVHCLPNPQDFNLSYTPTKVLDLELVVDNNLLAIISVCVLPDLNLLLMKFGEINLLLALGEAGQKEKQDPTNDGRSGAGATAKMQMRCRGKESLETYQYHV